MFSNELYIKADQLLASCRQKNILLSTAESCTGGLIIGLLTEIAGSSDVVDRGFVTYSNDAKSQLLGVSSETLEQYGAVSMQAVKEMALGAMKNSKANAAIAVSGIAGPGGGSTDKPVGLVHLAVTYNDKLIHHELRLGDIGRANVRLETIDKALDLLECIINDK